MNILKSRYYSETRFLLNIYGLWPYQSSTSKWIRLLFYYILVNLHVVPLVLYLTLRNPSLEEAFENLISISIAVANLIRQSVTLTSLSKLRLLLSQIKKHWKEITNPHELKILKDLAKESQLLSLFYIVVVTSACVFYFGCPLVTPLLEILFSLKNGSYPILVPLRGEYILFDQFSYFYSTFLYMLISCLYFSGLFAATDTIYLFCIQHVSGLFAIVHISQDIYIILKSTGLTIGMTLVVFYSNWLDQKIINSSEKVFNNAGPAIRVRAGTISMKSPESSVQERNVESRHKHSGYTPPSRYHDIGLLKLDEPWNFDGYVRPACLETNLEPIGKKAITIGFGKTSFDGEDTSDALLKVTLDYISNADCEKSFKQDIGTKSMPNGIIPNTLCAGVMTGGKDTCQGDSGGPLQRVLAEPYCMYSIVGVTSYGKFCGFANSPAIYTRVSSYLDWIEGLVWPGEK